ncbi:MAG: thiamine-phosphate kinase [Acidobacteria bacterium]|nr:MAG: thiamine-phosphate kinase [Acidobacteriota bacterium]
MKNEAGRPGATVSDYTERDLIARIQQRLPPAPDWLLVGIGDDAAVVEPEPNRVEVLSVDAIVDGVHVDRAFVPPEAIGHRALAVNLSDLAAMGALPRLALLSMALPRDFRVDDFDSVADGLAALASRHHMHIVGGNLTNTSGPLTVDVTVIGTVKRRQAMTRGGARAGDEIYVSGWIGSAAAGLRILKSSTAESSVSSLAERYLRPEPRIRLGLMLSRNRAATACVDLSDGLADGLHQIADASGVGVAINEEMLPIEPTARRIFERQTEDATLTAISAGDDYELLFTVRPRWRHRLGAAARHGGAPLSRIGVCTERRDVTIVRSGAVQPIPPGYSHFR